VNSGEEGLAVVNRILCKDGSCRLVEWHSKPDVSRGVTLSVGRDVTRVVNALESLEVEKSAAEHATRTKSEFLAIMSHEVSDLHFVLMLIRWTDSYSDECCGRDVQSFTGFSAFFRAARICASNSEK